MLSQNSIKKPIDLNDHLWTQWILSFAKVTEYLKYIDELDIKEFYDDLSKDPSITFVNSFFDIPTDWIK